MQKYTQTNKNKQHNIRNQFETFKNQYKSLWQHYTKTHNNSENQYKKHVHNLQNPYSNPYKHLHKFRKPNKTLRKTENQCNNLQNPHKNLQNTYKQAYSETCHKTSQNMSCVDLPKHLPNYSSMYKTVTQNYRQHVSSTSAQAPLPCGSEVSGWKIWFDELRDDVLKLLTCVCRSLMGF